MPSLNELWIITVYIFRHVDREELAETETYYFENWQAALKSFEMSWAKVGKVNYNSVTGEVTLTRNDAIQHGNPPPSIVGVIKLLRFSEVRTSPTHF